MRTVADSAPTLGPLGAATLERLGQQATAFWQWLMGAGCHLAKYAAAGGPGDDVAAVGDVDLSLIVTTLDTTTLVNRVELRV